MKTDKIWWYVLDATIPTTEQRRSHHIPRGVFMSQFEKSRGYKPEY